MREFKLKNKHGTEYDLMNINSFFSKPTGLGWGTESTIERIGEAYIVTETQEIQPAPSGEIVFSDYVEYKRFLEFCQVGDLVLCYKPFEKWMYLKCEIYIEKTEIQRETKKLICPVEFLGLSYWYEKLEYQTSPFNNNEGKTYPYKYPYSYSSSKSSVFYFEMPLPSFFKLEVLGECINPEWRCIRNGKVFAKGIINTTISSTHKLVVNTNPAEMEISEYTLKNEFVRNLYSESDFNTERIFSLPKGKSTFVVLSQSVQIPKAYMEITKHV